jgi:hypothetical protein
MSKYVKTTSNKCPVCGVESPKTGNTCGHLYKLTSKGIYFWMNSTNKGDICRRLNK